MMDQLMTIAIVAFGLVVGQTLYLFIREYKIRRLGPSKRQFTQAVEIVTLFIVHHNEQNPHAKIIHIQISESGVQ